MIPIAGGRALHKEVRPLVDAPGHLLDAAESDTGAGLFALTASFAWSSYLYCHLDDTTLLNWEGELFDFWTNRRDALEEMRWLLRKFNLVENPRQ